MYRLPALLLMLGFFSAGCASQPNQVQQCFASALRDCHAAWSRVEGRNDRTILIGGSNQMSYCDAMARKGCRRH
jgi:starvation-inducible outer membrane lipoprotein